MDGSEARLPALGPRSCKRGLYPLGGLSPGVGMVFPRRMLGEVRGPNTVPGLMSVFIPSVKHARD